MPLMPLVKRMALSAMLVVLPVALGTASAQQQSEKTFPEDMQVQKTAPAPLAPAARPASPRPPEKASEALRRHVDNAKQHLRDAKQHLKDAKQHLKDLDQPAGKPAATEEKK